MESGDRLHHAHRRDGRHGRAVEEGFPQRESPRAPTAQRELESGERVMVGVNEFRTDGDERIPLLRIDESVARAQTARLQAIRSERSADSVKVTLAGVERACRDGSTSCPPSSRPRRPNRYPGRGLRRVPQGLGAVPRGRPLRRPGGLPSTRHWADDYYGDLYYESVADLLTARMSGFEAGLLRRLLELSPRYRLLDLCCGHGRHARRSLPRSGCRRASTGSRSIWHWPGTPAPRWSG